jgi:hypothetical protein
LAAAIGKVEGCSSIKTKSHHDELRQKRVGFLEGAVGNIVIPEELGDGLFALQF